MQLIAYIPAPLLPQKPTCFKVHKTIQEMDSKLLNCNNVIPIHTLAEELHVNSEDLSESVNILLNLCYIKFTDRKHDNIYLTSTGKNTIVPE